jgi:hypothetical protein
MALSETLFSMRCLQPVEVSGILGLRQGCCGGGAMKQSWRAVPLDYFAPLTMTGRTFFFLRNAAVSQKTSHGFPKSAAYRNKNVARFYLKRRTFFLRVPHLVTKTSYVFT